MRGVCESINLHLGVWPSSYIFDIFFTAKRVWLRKLSFT